MAATVPVGLVSVAVTTRFLEPADYGRLAVLFALGSMLTIIGGLGFTTGTMFATYGVADDDGDGDGIDAAIELDERDATFEERRRLMGSGTLILVCVSAIACGLVAGAAKPVADVFVGHSQTAAVEVRLMALSAWSGSVWRLIHQVFRMERRAVAWSLLQWSRPVLVLAASAGALETGMGVRGVLVATFAGTVASILIALVVSRASFKFAPKRGDVKWIWSFGVKWVPLQFTRALQGNVGILLLSLLAPASSVGVYQVASRVAQVPAFFGEGFLLAWVPLERTMLSQASKRDRGALSHQAAIFLLLALASGALLLTVVLAADGLVRIASAEYRRAAALVPLLAVAHISDVLFRGIYRATAFPHHRWWFTLAHLLWVFPYAGAVVIGVELMSQSYAVAFAQLVGWVALSIFLVVLDIRSVQSTPFAWGRMFRAAALIAAIIVVSIKLPDHSALHLAWAVIGVIAFPPLILATRVIRRSQVVAVQAVLAELVPDRIHRRRISRSLDELPPSDQAAVRAIAAQRLGLDEAAARLGLPRAVAAARLTRGIRRIFGGGADRPLDAEIGDHLTAGGTRLAKDLRAQGLWRRGADPLELYELERGLEQVQRVFGPLWRRRHRKR